MRRPRCGSTLSAAMFGVALWVSPPGQHAIAQLKAAAADEGRVYHLVSTGELATTEHTHVCVAGTATLVKREADGDLHVRIEAGNVAIVAEEIPRLRAIGPRPALHRHVVACGISREDKKHKWWEVHPVEEWRQ